MIKKYVRLYLLALVLIFISDVGYSSEKISMAVLDMDANNVSAMTSATVTDLLRTELFNTGRFTVAERKNMDKILKEQTFQQAGCTDTECAVEVGKLLNINQIAVGSVSKLGEKYLINIRMVDVEKGSVLLAESIQCDSEDKLGEAVKTLAFNVSKRVPVIGKILYVSGEEVIINVGAADEVRVGMKFGVERLGQAIKDDKGKVIMQEKDRVAEIELISVDNEASKAKIINKKKDVVTGDTVRIAEAELIKREVKKSVPAEKLVEPKKEIGVVVPTEKSAGGAALRSLIIPGWGQFYSDRTIMGIVYLGIEALMITNAVSKYTEYDGDYQKYKGETNPTLINEYYNKANTAYSDFTNVVSGIMIVWVINVVDSFIFFPAQTTSTSALPYNKNGLCLDVIPKHSDIALDFSYKLRF